VAAYNAWTSAGFPASKLVLGIPSYGYVSTSNSTRLKTRSPRRQVRSSVKVVDEDGGQVQFRDLLSQGALVRCEDARDEESTSPTFAAYGGFERNWDDCSCTPFLRSSSSGQVVTYDDPVSVRMKAAFVKEVGMLGTNMFDIHGDTDQWDLTDSIRKAMGLTT
jgi:chitinase